MRLRRSIATFLVLAMLSTASMSALAFAVTPDEVADAAAVEETYIPAVAEEVPAAEVLTEAPIPPVEEAPAAGAPSGEGAATAPSAPIVTPMATAAQTRTVPLDLTAAASEVNVAEGWTWDAASMELTLDGIDFNVALAPGNMRGIIVPDGTTIIIANGSTNSIVTADAPGTAGTNMAIESHGALTITNEAGSGVSGVLNITAGQGINVYGIHSWGTLGAIIFNGGTVNITAGDAINNLGWGGYSEGIANWGAVHFNSGTTTLTSGNASHQSYGINVAGNIFVGVPGASPTASTPLVTATSGNTLGDVGGSGARLGHHSVGMLANELHFHNGTATAHSGTAGNPTSMSSAFWGWTRGITMGEFSYVRTPVNGVLGYSTNLAPLANSVVRDAADEVVQTSAVISVRAFTVTFDGNGNTAGTAPVNDNLYSLESTTTILGQGTLVKDGYRFLGWAYESDATAPDWLEGDERLVTDNVTLFAVWERVGTLDPDTDGNGNNDTADPDTNDNGNDDTDDNGDETARRPVVGPKTGDIINNFMQIALAAALVATFAIAGLVRTREQS